MKTMMLLLAMLSLAACEKKPDPMIESGRDKILRDAVAAKDAAERRVGELEQENSDLSMRLDITENRLKIATDAAALYDRLLDDSNEAKLRRVRKMLDEAEGK